MNILHIDSSLFSAQGQSAQLGAKLVAALREKHPRAQYTHRDLAANELPHFNASTVAAISKGEASLADALIAEVENADVLVLGAPMYNFSIPTQLKTWLDHIARAGRTFKYTDKGPVGLLKGKKVYVISTRGGQHRDSDRDGVAPYLKTMLGFLGLGENLEFVYAEGLAVSALRDKALLEAEHEIATLTESEEKAA